MQINRVFLAESSKNLAFKLATLIGSNVLRYSKPEVRFQTQRLMLYRDALAVQLRATSLEHASCNTTIYLLSSNGENGPHRSTWIRSHISSQLKGCNASRNDSLSDLETAHFHSCGVLNHVSNSASRIEHRSSYGFLALESTQVTCIVMNFLEYMYLFTWILYVQSSTVPLFQENSVINYREIIGLFAA